MRSATFTPIALTGSLVSLPGLFRSVMLRLLGPLALALRPRKPTTPKTSDTSVLQERSSIIPGKHAAVLLLVQLGDAVQPIEGGHLVALRQRRIVEDRVHKVLQLTAESHYSLPDVQQLACALADDMHAENQMVLAMEDQLQTSCRIAANLPARNLTVVSHPYLVGHVLFCELFLGLADEADLRNRVDAVGVKAMIRHHVVIAERARRRDASLFHRNRSERREANHIAH